MASAKKRSVTKKASGSKKANTTIPSGRIGSMLRKGRFARRVSKSAGAYLAGVLSYLTHELLEVAAKGAKKGRVSPRSLTLAVRADEELGSLLKDVTISRGGVPAGINKALEKKKKASKKGGKKSKKAGSKKSKKSSKKQ
jgi:histone H2A